ncbi:MULTISPECIES: hypothetical protein [unclassified Streptomyces]|uniref:hypothetical protein n=1 Tax=unclassified Streptomyces TaxID=2593676 RepID=UPI002E2A55CF|nr:hypothetical protein [Streptomyces sp. NBC_00228]
MSELDNARAAFKHFGLLPGFIGALERFEAAVRANERAGIDRCTCRQAVHATHHTAFVQGCAWCHTRERKP